jgi:radical SAM superfamily enzyme YgiQ (UPF0313 family)
MHYEGDVYRPPSEANSILLQVTTGCSHNNCTFCGMYRNSRFRIKERETVMADIDFAAQHCQRQRRLFLCDGDALIMPQKRLVEILGAIRVKLPWVERVSSYASTDSIKRKSVAELEELRELGLKLAYLGLESGDDATLAAINKNGDADTMIEMGRKIRSAGIHLSITVILGIAQRERSEVHARESGRVLSAIDPEYVGALSLMLTPGTPIYQQYESGSWELPGPDEMLRELQIMLEHTELTNGYFHANHASNYLPIKAKLPQDKRRTLALIQQALDGRIGLKPEYMRGL